MSDLDETLMRKTSQLCPPYLNTNSYLSQKLEDFIHVTDPNHHKVDHVVDERRILLSKEELNLEREIIRLIHTGKSETLKPNSLQSVVINEHHICVACREDTDPDYRVWEWHGHIMFNDPENGFTPEYVYGNYFEKTLMKELADEDEQFYEEEEDDGLLNLGLRGLMDGGSDSKSIGACIVSNPNLFSSKFSFAVSSRSGPLLLLYFPMLDQRYYSFSMATDFIGHTGHECSSYCDKLVSTELTAAELKFTGGFSVSFRQLNASMRRTGAS